MVLYSNKLIFMRCLFACKHNVQSKFMTSYPSSYIVKEVNTDSVFEYCVFQAGIAAMIAEQLGWLEKVTDDTPTNDFIEKKETFDKYTQPIINKLLNPDNGLYWHFCEFAYKAVFKSYQRGTIGATICGWLGESVQCQCAAMQGINRLPLDCKSSSANHYTVCPIIKSCKSMDVQFFFKRGVPGTDVLQFVKRW